MMAGNRKRKRIHKFRGTRSCGTGNTKNKRGSGCKGGVGRAGFHKHRFTYVTKYEREFMRHGGRFGFHNPTTKEVDAINLYEINNMLKKGKITDKFEFNGKILGTGEISKAVEITAISATKKAIARIEKAGGKFVQLAKKENKAGKKEENEKIDAKAGENKIEEKNKAEAKKEVKKSENKAGGKIIEKEKSDAKKAGEEKEIK
ncbi:MAG: uL15m family ribosomal protein [Candidatus Micrarchaeota archaeon]